MTDKPIVSVIIPTHNRSELLMRAIKSVLGQSFTSLECIVVDDASSDDTELRVKGFKDERLRYFKNTYNLHASGSRNIGIINARGKYIAFLDDDDEWLPTKLEKQVKLIENLSNSIGMIYCWMDYYDLNGNVVNKHHPTYRGNVFPLVLDKQRIGGCPTLLVRREVIEKVGGFDVNLPRGNDGDFIRRVCLYYEVDLVPEVLVKVHIGHERITTNWTKAGALDSITSQKVKLKKFSNSLCIYNLQKSNILASIGYYNSMLPCCKSSVFYYYRALLCKPSNVNIYRYMYKSLKIIILGVIKNDL